MVGFSSGLLPREDKGGHSGVDDLSGDERQEDGETDPDKGPEVGGGVSKLSKKPDIRNIDARLYSYKKGGGAK